MTLSQQTTKTSTPLMQQLLKDLPVTFPTPIIDIVADYCSAQQPFPADLIQLAQDCIAAFNQGKDLEEETSSWPPRAQGVANRLTRFNEAQIKIIFNAWKEEADDWDEKDEVRHKNQFWGEGKVEQRNIFCSSYRLLIAYYLPIADLKPAAAYYIEYKIMAVQQYVMSAEVDAKNPLIHALRIKFAVANGSHIEAMELIRKSSANLNLKGADLSIEGQYDFSMIDLSKACLENTILSKNFDCRLLSFSVKGANFKNAEILSYPGVYAYQAFHEIFSQAEGGLDIRYINLRGRGSFLHSLAQQIWDIDSSNFHEMQSLLQHGAAVTVLDDEGNLPCSHAMITYNSFGYYTFRDSVQYSQLIANLNEDELEQQKNLSQKRRNKSLFYLGIMFFILFAAAVLFACGILAVDGMGPIAQIATPYSGLFLFIGAVSGFAGVGGLAISVYTNTLIIPDVLCSILINYHEIRQAIECQRLANNPGPKQKDYQFHLLFKKKYLAQNIDVPANGVPNTNDYFTPPEKLLFASLNSREQLLAQKKLNKELASKDKLDAARIFFMGLILVAVAALAALMVVYSPLSGVVFPHPETFLSTLDLEAVFIVTPCTFYLFHSLRFFYKAITKWQDSNKTNKAIDQMIQEKLDALPAVELVLAPASELKLTPTKSPKLTVALEPERTLRVTSPSPSAIGIGLYPVSPSKEKRLEAEAVVQQAKRL